MEEQYARVNTPNERLTDRERIPVGRHVSHGFMVDKETANEIVELLNTILCDARGLKGLANAYLVEVAGGPFEEYEIGLCRGTEALGDRIVRFSSYILDLFVR